MLASPLQLACAALAGGLVSATCWAIVATAAARHWWREARHYRRQAVAFHCCEHDRELEQLLNLPGDESK